MSCADREGHIILWVSECIPDVPYVRVGYYIDKAGAREFGYRNEGWFIWDEHASSWDIIDLDTPKGWMPLPDKVVDPALVGRWRNPTDEEMERAIARWGRRDSDRSGEAIETPKSGSTEGESAGPKGIAQPEPHP